MIEFQILRWLTKIAISAQIIVQNLACDHWNANLFAFNVDGFTVITTYIALRLPDYLYNAVTMRPMFYTKFCFAYVWSSEIKISSTEYLSINHFYVMEERNEKVMKYKA